MTKTDRGLNKNGNTYSQRTKQDTGVLISNLCNKKGEFSNYGNGN